MKFAKGVIVGGIITTGLFMMYNNTNSIGKRGIIKRGKKMARRMGIL